VVLFHFRIKLKQYAFAMSGTGVSGVKLNQAEDNHHITTNIKNYPMCKK